MGKRQVEISRSMLHRWNHVEWSHESGETHGRRYYGRIRQLVLGRGEGLKSADVYQHVYLLRALYRLSLGLQLPGFSLEDGQARHREELPKCCYWLVIPCVGHMSVSQAPYTLSLKIFSLQLGKWIPKFPDLMLIPDQQTVLILRIWIFYSRVPCDWSLGNQFRLDRFECED
jgi:hypothetical protein